ncbi:MAG: hydrogenase-4 component G [Deltaproteobacteria bacterium]|nr:MAG: hydrogenase-4 component G [Deltaproteobacteria bacterium]
MVSVQTNLSVLSAVKEHSFQTTSQAVNKKNTLKGSTQSEIFQFSYQIKTDTWQNLSDQNAILHFNQLNTADKSSLFYKNTPISELSAHEATALVQEDGYFGIDKTSQRIIDFVIKGAGNDVERLKAGRQGVLRGFSEAGKAWGGDLPDLSYKTIEKAIKTLDDRIAELGGSPTKITV